MGCVHRIPSYRMFSLVLFWKYSGVGTHYSQPTVLPPPLTHSSPELAVREFCRLRARFREPLQRFSLRRLQMAGGACATLSGMLWKIEQITLLTNSKNEKQWPEHSSNKENTHWIQCALLYSMQCASPSRSMVARMTYETRLLLHAWHMRLAAIFFLIQLCFIIFVHQKNKATYRTNHRSIMWIILHHTAIIMHWNEIWFHRMKQYRRPSGTSVLRPGSASVWGHKLPGSEALGGMRPSASKSRATPITSRPRNLFIYEK